MKFAYDFHIVLISLRNEMASSFMTYAMATWLVCGEI